MNKSFIDSTSSGMANSVLSSAVSIKLLEKKEKDDSRSVAFYDLSKLKTRYQLWMDNLPNIKPFYAVKSNNNPLVLQYLASLGTGFDCASQSEIETVLSLGVSPENIIFAQTCKYESHLKYSAENNVSLMTFDNEPELHKISSLYPTAQLIIRIKSDSKQSLLKLGVKFGCTVSEAKGLLHVARDLSLNVIGVSFHVGCYCQEPEGHCTAIVKAHEVFEYAKGIGFNFTHLDLGGGFVGNEKGNDIFIQIAAEINKTIAKQFKDYKRLIIISEPGTFFSQSCVTIATQIIGKKSVIIDAEPSGQNETTVYYINDNRPYGNLNFLLCIDKRTVHPFNRLKQVKPKTLCPSFICGTGDKLIDEIGPELLPNMEVGDWLLFLESGNYNTVSCREQSLAAEVVYCKDNAELFPCEQVEYTHKKDEGNDSPTIHEVTSSNINEFISEQLITICKTPGKSTPVGFCNLSRIAARYHLWTKYLPNVKPFYATKSNSDPIILNHLASLGTGFECGTQEGIETVLELGVSPVNAIITTTCKPISYIKYAARRNICSLMTFDLESELHKIASHHQTAELLINISPTVRPGLCDGCSISESLHLLQSAQILGLHVVGVRFSFHSTVSSNQSVESYQTAIAMAYQVFQQARTVGFNFNILDIGEGFSGSEDKNDLFIEIAESINKCVAEQFKGYPNLTVLAEPGSFLVASCLTIATKIHGKRPVTSDNATVYYHIDDGIFGSFSRNQYKDTVCKPVPLLKPAGFEELIPCTVWGPTCQSTDKLGSFDLPNLNIGDYLLFCEMGAYSTVASTRFNGLGGDIDTVYFTEK